MPYALFEDDDQLSRAFNTEAEVWKHAAEAGLVEIVGDTERLEDHLAIKPVQQGEPLIASAAPSASKS
jgi:hypothetical protein